MLKTLPKGGTEVGAVKAPPGKHDSADVSSFAQACRVNNRVLRAYRVLKVGSWMAGALKVGCEEAIGWQIQLGRTQHT